MHCTVTNWCVGVGGEEVSDRLDTASDKRPDKPEGLSEVDDVKLLVAFKLPFGQMTEVYLRELVYGDPFLPLSGMEFESTVKKGRRGCHIERLPTIAELDNTHEFTQKV